MSTMFGFYATDDCNSTITLWTLHFITIQHNGVLMLKDKPQISKK